MPNYMYTKKTNIQAPAPVTKVPPKLNAALGTGLRFPLLLVDQMWAGLGGVDKVKQDVFLTLATPVGRRFLYPSFGSMLPYYVFQRITPALLLDIQNQVLAALKSWVPYIIVNSVVANQFNALDGNAVQIAINYSIVSTQSSENLFIVMNDINNIAPSAFKINGVSVLKG